MTQTFGFAEARLRCSKYLPYTYSHVAALIPVPKPGLGVPACVDKHMRVYFDPAIFDEWSIDECTAVILHEDMHLLLGHHKRAAEYLGENATSEDLELWNTACDMTVNYTLQQAGVPCRDDWVFAEKFGFPPNLSVEDYWERLKAQQEPEEEEEEPGDSPTDSDKPGDGDSEDGGEDGQDGDSDDSAPQDDGEDDADRQPGDGPGSSGSCSDGQDKPWEDPVDSDTPVMEDFDQKMLETDAARRMEQYAKSQGTLPGGLTQWADGILRPKIDPFRRLRAAVRATVTTTRGMGDYTFLRPSRRQPSGSLRLPASVQPVPKVAVIVDTSGSMDATALAKALGVVQQGLTSVPSDRIDVIAGDTCAQTTQRVFKAQDVVLAGGGGTDMGAIVEEVATGRPAPDAIVVVTDGWTPWPDERVRPKCVVCLTEPARKDRVPNWMTTVVLE